MTLRGWMWSLRLLLLFSPELVLLHSSWSRGYHCLRREWTIHTVGDLVNKCRFLGQQSPVCLMVDLDYP